MAFTAFASAAEAAEGRAGKFSLSLRAGNLFGSAKVDGIPNIGPVGFTPEGFIPGSDIDVDDSFVATFIPSYHFSEHFAVDMFIATPAFFGITSKGLEGFGVTDIGKIEVLVPTIYLTTYPAPVDWKLQPTFSVGFGTMIKSADDQISSQVEAALGQGTELSVANDKFVPSARAGLDYMVTDKWSFGVHATMFWGQFGATINPTAEIPIGPGITAPLGSFTTDLKLNALVIQSGITYRF